MAGNAPDLDPLDEAAVDAVRAQGLVDIEEADSLDALKAVRAALLGDQAPLVTANRTIGSLEPSKRGLAGKNLGQARKALTEALDARKEILAAEHEARMLVEESVDVTVPTRRRAAGARTGDDAFRGGRSGGQCRVDDLDHREHFRQPPDRQRLFPQQ